MNSPTRTPVEAYLRIIQGIDVGLVDPSRFRGQSCKYEADIKGQYTRCGVGALFTKAQLANLKARRLNNKEISMVVERIGKRNIEHVTGLSVPELVELQRKHDGVGGCSSKQAKNELREYLVSKIKQANGGKDLVRYVVFIDDERRDAHDTFKDAQFDAHNTSCMEHAIYREVNGVLGKCLERLREPASSGAGDFGW